MLDAVVRTAHGTLGAALGQTPPAAAVLAAVVNTLTPMQYFCSTFHGHGQNGMYGCSGAPPGHPGDHCGPPGASPALWGRNGAAG